VRKFLCVLGYEYRHGVFRWGFLFGLLSLPFMIALSGLFIFLSLLPEFSLEPVGYVDYSGLLANGDVSARPISNLIEFIHYQDEDAARAALEAGEIQEYYVLEADFIHTSQARLVARRQMNVFAQSAFSSYVRDELASAYPAQVVQRAISGANLSVRALDGSRQTEGLLGYLSVYMPAMAGFGLMIFVFSSSGYLLSAILEERSNRTLEMLVTSVSALQLIGGKTIALLGVGVTQFLFWFTPLLLLFLIRPQDGLRLAAQLFPANSLALIALTFIPALVMIAALMVIIGSISAEARDAQIISSLVFLPIYVPLALLSLITKNPNSPLAIGLSFFPLTAPVTVVVRNAVLPIPPGQVVLIVTALVVCALVCMWAASRAWRIGLWNPGLRISLKRFSLCRLLRRNRSLEDGLPL
jgi:ABC-2 type transport system permease protein